MTKGTTTSVLDGQVWAKQNKWYGTRVGQTINAFIHEQGGTRKKTIMDRIRLLNNFKAIGGWSEQSYSFYCFQIVTTSLLLQIFA